MTKQQFDEWFLSLSISDQIGIRNHERLVFEVTLNKLTFIETLLFYFVPYFRRKYIYRMISQIIAKR